MDQAEIDRTLHMRRKTDRRMIRAGQFPERAKPHRGPRGIKRFQEFLISRWAEGCHNATQLWREIQVQGYTGGRSTMAKFVAMLRTQGTAAPRQPKAKPPSPRQDSHTVCTPARKAEAR